MVIYAVRSAGSGIYAVGIGRGEAGVLGLFGLPNPPLGRRLSVGFSPAEGSYLRLIDVSLNSRLPDPSLGRRLSVRLPPAEGSYLRLMNRAIQEQLLRRNVKRCRGGLVCEAHRRLYHSTLGLIVIKKKKTSSCAKRRQHPPTHPHTPTPTQRHT